MIKYNIFLLLLVAFLSGCRGPEEPRLRISSYFGSPNGIEFADPCDLGHHNYFAQHNEKSGLIYSCKAGFLDLGHIREAADRTAYVYHLVYENLMKGQRRFEFRVIEPSHYQLSILYPSDWAQRTEAEKESIARQVAIKLGQDVAHISLIWHEIITWYGFASTGIFSEKISSFSWEDTYSDALGTTIAVKALQDDRAYDDAVTDILYSTLQELDAQSPRVTKRAFEQIEGKWFEGGMYFFVKMNKRNFETGFETGRVVPWLVPDICPCTEPQPCLIPRPAKEDLHGFTAELLMQPRVMEEKKIYKDLGIKRTGLLNPNEHFPRLLSHIIAEAKQRQGKSVSRPLLEDSPVLSSRLAREAADAVQ